MRSILLPASLPVNSYYNESLLSDTRSYSGMRVTKWLPSVLFLCLLGVVSFSLDVEARRPRPLKAVARWWHAHHPHEVAQPTAESDANPVGGAAPVPFLRRAYEAPTNTLAMESFSEALSPEFQWLQVPTETRSQLTSVIKTHNPALSAGRINQLGLAIVHSSIKNQIDYRLLASVMAVESSYDSEAISSSGALGLGQFLPATAKYMKVTNPFDPMDNAMGMGRYLSYLVNKFGGDYSRAIGSYYVGPGTVTRQGLTPPAQKYVSKVNRVLLQFEGG